MGVSGYFKWLTKKYPNIMSKVIENHETDMNPTDASLPNPNGFEIDNLYLDMNGIIHPCCHPEGEKQPESEEEMMTIIMQYMDRIFKAVRPRKLLYMAIDGVAPRAKMNQQRSRRYRSAKEAEKNEHIKQEHIKEYQERGLDVPEELKNESHWDSNVITPGTPFMDKVANALRTFVQAKITNDPAWKNIKVVFTDSNSPGEGEHKIIEYIRLQRLQENYNPNTSHCIHGLDADLIMLALSTHEPHFYILREQIFDKGRPVDLQKKKAGASVYEYKPLNFLHVSVLREYLREEFHMTQLPFAYDFERIIDDYIFLCFFVGNDFLPHLPSMDIREGALDTIINLYKKYLPFLKGYMTNCGEINIPRAQYLLQHIGFREDSIFVNRMRRKRIQAERRKRREEEKAKKKNPPKPKDLVKVSDDKKSKENFERKAEAENGEKKVSHKRKRAGITDTAPPKDTISQKISKLEGEIPTKKKKLNTGKTVDTSEPTEKDEGEEYEDEETMNKKNDDLSLDEEESRDEEAYDTGFPSDSLEVPDLAKPDAEQSKEFMDSLKQKLQDSRVVDAKKHPDDVRFGEQGWKQRYFKNKLGIDYDENLTSPKLNHLLISYFEGLAWVLKYYYEGCVSWSWYYPYHYAPFASDLSRVKDVNIEFKKGEPFRPFTQLLAVFPKASAHALPEPFQRIMDQPDMKQFYPDDFEIDLNGKRFEWMGVALLPFLDEHKLLRAVHEVEDTLTEEEKERNSFRPTTLYVHGEHAAAKSILSSYEGDRKKVTLPKTLDIRGIVSPLPKQIRNEYEKPMDIPESYSAVVGKIRQNMAVSCAYQTPNSDKKHASHLMYGLQFPTLFLPIFRQLGIEGDMEQTSLVYKKDFQGAKRLAEQSNQQQRGPPRHYMHGQHRRHQNMAQNSYPNQGQFSQRPPGPPGGYPPAGYPPPQYQQHGEPGGYPPGAPYGPPPGQYGGPGFGPNRGFYPQRGGYPPQQHPGYPPNARFGGNNQRGSHRSRHPNRGRHQRRGR